MILAKGRVPWNLAGEADLPVPLFAGLWLWTNHLDSLCLSFLVPRQYNEILVRIRDKVCKFPAQFLAYVHIRNSVSSGIRSLSEWRSL